jgi:hypothetical protein
MSQLFHSPQYVRIDSTGTPYAGAKANFYLTGTTTRTNTYTDSARTIAHANPVVADAAGQFAAIYLVPSVTYRCVITESDDTLIDDIDPYGTPLTSSDIAVVDAGGYYAGTEVETVLADVGANYAKKSASNTWSAEQTYSATLNMADNILQRPEIKDFSVTHNAVTSTANAVTVDCSTGNSFYHLLTENTTITPSNPPATGKYGQVVILIQQDSAGGAYTVSWPAAVLWAAGAAPTITVSNDALDLITLSTIDAGTTWFGTFAQAFA